MPEILHDVLTPLIGRAADLCDAGMELIDSLALKKGHGSLARGIGNPTQADRLGCPGGW